MAVKDKLIVAFDSPDLSENLRLARKLRGIAKYAKIGSVLFTAAGPEAITRFRGLGFEVFLDLKFHDIPTTVEKSARSASLHRVWMFTVHACGGKEMMKAAIFGARDESKRCGLSCPKVVGVTVLTSTAAKGAAARVHTLASEAKVAGINGVVCSVHEAASIRKKTGKDFTIVCPGIRMPGIDAQDQKRVATPAAAMAAGADFIVVGRPITSASDPRKAAKLIIQDMER